MLVPKSPYYPKDEEDFVDIPSNYQDSLSILKRKVERIIDAHAHCQMSDESHLLNYVKSFGLSKIVVASLDTKTARLYDQYISNDFVIQLSNKYSFVIPFISIDVTFKDYEKIFEHYISKYNVGGVGEIKLRVKLLDRRLLKVLRKAGKNSLPVIIHIGKDMDYPVEDAYKLVQLLPETNIIFHGPSWWEKLWTDKEFVEEVLENENAFADISGRRFLYYTMKMEKNERIHFLERFNKKLIFGTDFPSLGYNSLPLGMDGSHFHYFLVNEISEHSLNNIFYKNFEGIINNL